VRLTLEVMRAVRGAVSKTMAVGIRIGPDLTLGGVDVQTCINLAQALEAENLVDFIDLSVGNYQNIERISGGLHEGSGYELPLIRPIAQAVSSPRMVTGLFRTLQEADAVIRSGDADLVSLARAHIADPDLVRKSLGGRSDDVRPCIGCNQGCLGGLFGPRRRVGCTVNPEAGREHPLAQDVATPARRRKKIVVIGAGPAGLEAARTAAVRGHNVILMEAQPVLGGLVRLASRTPTRAGLMDIVLWQEEQLGKLGVDIRTNCYAEVDDVLVERPDQVLLATGSTPRLDGIQVSNPGEAIKGFDSARVLSSHEVLSGRSPVGFGKRAVVIDDVGHFEGLAVAEFLHAAGLQICFVTRHNSVAPQMEGAMMVSPALRRIGATGFEARLRSRVLSMDGEGVVIAPTYLGASQQNGERVSAEVVVFVSDNRPNNALVAELGKIGVETTVIGDAKAPRFMQVAIREGYLAALAI
jgi:hypothetical protein